MLRSLVGSEMCIRDRFLHLCPTKPDFSPSYVPRQCPHHPRALSQWVRHPTPFAPLLLEKLLNQKLPPNVLSVRPGIDPAYTQLRSCTLGEHVLLGHVGLRDVPIS
eukprot:TRINITY_DN4409_c0_g1_i4.p1 TRINITY_DN4409_c0_g1~~TRINITY_DN4409_c0_g1_i4.p1  ORF type:complete len:106 (+),score=8.66 TRINITY_DN4409_c0_g1_i4:143-460(+)